MKLSVILGYDTFAFFQFYDVPEGVISIYMSFILFVLFYGLITLIFYYMHIQTEQDKFFTKMAIEV